jgi:RNA polymerase sigma factor (sigma-70 family)
MAATEISTRANVALDDLYRHHVGEVYRYTYAVLGNHADAEDVTQTTFVNALRALERGDSPDNGSAWLIAIAQNVVRQRWRQAASRPAEVELVHDVPEMPAEEDIEVDELVRALQRIPPAQREALVMRELEGRSYNEIAGLLGLTTSALETLLFRARRSLAEELENVVTCQNAELAMSKQLDGRLSRKERRRLDEHLAECPDCARLAEMQKRQRRAFKGLAVLPIPIGLALFKGAPSASAASSLPTIGLGATGTTSNGAAGATGVGVGGATSGGAVAGGSLVAAAAKVAAVIVAATVATGIAYKAVQLTRGGSPESTRTSVVQEATAAPAQTTARRAATAATRRAATGAAGASVQPTGAVGAGAHGTKAVAGGVAMESETSVVEHVAGGRHVGDGASPAAGTASGAPSASPGTPAGGAPRTSAPPAVKPAPKQPPTAAPKPKPAPPTAKPKPIAPGSGAPGTGTGTGSGATPTSPGGDGSAGAGPGSTGTTSGGGGQGAGDGQPGAGTETGGSSSPPPAPSSDPTSGEGSGAGCPGGGAGPGNGEGCGIGNAYGADNGKAKQ